MTAICGGGTSSAQSGFAQSLFVGPSMIGALLNNIPTLWAVPLAGYIGAVTYDLSTFCPADPPAVPTITAADVFGLLDVYNPALNVPAGEKFQQLIGAYLWYLVCKCDSVATPAPPAAPAAPSGMPAINPTLVPPISSSGCYDVTQTQQDSQNSFITVAGSPIYLLTPDYFNVLGPLVVPYTATNVQSYAIPSGATQFAFTIHTISGGPSTDHGGIIKVGWWTSAGAANGATFIDAPPNGSTTAHTPVAVPAGTAYITVAQDGQDWTGDWLYTLELRFFCGTTAPVTEQPCCPPDPQLSARLDAILGLVTTIQRQIAPFAYVAQSPVTGLSGNGHISVQGVIGARVTITSFPSNVGLEDGDPNVVWDAGWVNFGDASGYASRQFISASPITFFPAAAGQFTRIGYSLSSGVTATITPLVRES